MSDHFRCGDTVRHRPSGETWIVAYADYEVNDLSPCGWPETVARITDCDLVRSASDDEHRSLVGRWMEKGQRDMRSIRVARLYGEANQ